jgi:hypothetical protein
LRIDGRIAASEHPPAPRLQALDAEAYVGLDALGLAPWDPAALTGIFQEDCCTLKVGYRVPKGSKLDRADKEKLEALQKKLDGVAEFFKKEFKICIEWEKLEAIDLGADGAVHAGGSKKPQVADALTGASAPKPILVFVDQNDLQWHESTDTETKVEKYKAINGFTSEPGANGAIVEVTSDRSSDLDYIRNELYHVLGLSDDELGASLTQTKHNKPNKEQADFMKKVCEESKKGDAAKKKAVEDRAKK